MLEYHKKKMHPALESPKSSKKQYRIWIRVAFVFLGVFELPGSFSCLKKESPSRMNMERETKKQWAVGEWPEVWKYQDQGLMY